MVISLNCIRSTGGMSPHILMKRNADRANRNSIAVYFVICLSDRGLSNILYLLKMRHTVDYVAGIAFPFLLAVDNPGTEKEASPKHKPAHAKYCNY
jgi:hypothetical protein